MGNSKANSIFGFGFIFAGVLELILAIVILTDLSLIVSSKANIGIFSSAVLILKYLRAALFVGSIVMLILNLKEGSKTVKGYLIALGGMIIAQLLTAPYNVFVQSIVLLVAGYMITKKNEHKAKIFDNTAQMEKDTDWFYGNNDK